MKRMPHLKYYHEYIKEQLEDEAMGMTDGDMQAAPAPKDQDHTMIFMKEGDKGTYKFPDGSTLHSYPTYKISGSNLSKWMDDSIKSTKEENYSKGAISVKKKNLFDYIVGKKESIPPSDFQYLIKFKNAITSGQIGTKIKETEVVFSNRDNIPTTDDLEVTFIKIPKDK